MVDVTNTSQGLRGVNTEDQGTVWLQPGETRDLQISAAEMKVMQRCGKDLGLFQGSFAGAKQAVTQAQDEGDMGDLGDVSGITNEPPGTNYADVTTTDVPQVAVTNHPIPAHQDVSEPEQPLESFTAVAPWGDAGTAGGAAPVAQDGETAAAKRAAKARG